MRQLKAFINKNVIKRIRHNHRYDGLYLVDPYNQFWDICKRSFGQSNLNDYFPDATDPIGFWVLNEEQIDQMFVVDCRENEIMRYMRIWPLDRFKDPDKYMDDYIANRDDEEPEMLGNVHCLTYKEIEKIWDL